MLHYWYLILHTVHSFLVVAFPVFQNSDTNSTECLYQVPSHGWLIWGEISENVDVNLMAHLFHFFMPYLLVNLIFLGVWELSLQDTFLIEGSTGCSCAEGPGSSLFKAACELGSSPGSTSRTSSLHTSNCPALSLSRREGACFYSLHCFVAEAMGLALNTELEGGG